MAFWYLKMILEIFYFIAILAVGNIIGRKVISLIGIEPDSVLEGFLVSISIGMGCLSFITFGLGIIGLLHNWIFVALFSIIILLFSKELIITAKGLLDYLRRFNYRQITQAINISIILAIFVIFILLNLIAVFAPPSEMDTLSYHLAVPKLYATSHKIYYIPDIPYSNFPFFTEMLFTLGLFHSSSLAIMFTFFFSIGTVLAIYLLTKRFISAKAALLASIIFYSLPIISERSSQALVEIPLTFYTIVSFYALFKWMESKSQRWLIVSAVFSGFVASIKLNGTFHIIIVSCIVIYWLLAKCKASFKTTLKALFIYGGIAIIIVSFWYIKSYIYTGNPVYPFMYKLFGGEYWSHYLSEYQAEALANYGIGNGILDYIFLPWNITIHGAAFDSFTGISPVFLGFLPLLFFIIREKLDKAKYLLFYSLVFITIWFFSSQQARFLLPVLALLTIVASLTIIRLLERPLLKPIIGMLVIFMLLFNLVLALGINIKKIPVAMGIESKEKYLANLKDFNPYNVSEFINDLEPKSKTLLIGLFRVYYIDNRFVHGTPALQGFVDYSKIRDEDSFAKKLEELNISHIAIERHFANDIINKNIPYLNEFLNNSAVLVYEHRGTKVYQLKVNGKV